VSSVRSPLSEALAPFTSVVITGGSSGIGKSFIELCAKLKPELTFCNLSRRNPGEIKFVKRLNHFSCDLALPAEAARAVGEVEALLRREVPLGEVLLINNSGFGAMGVFPEPNLARQLEMIDVNVRAVVQVTGQFLPFLRERGGAIINVASTAAFQPTPSMATYGATKAFLLHWSLALGDELRGSGVRTLAVCPGSTATEFFREAGLEPGNAAARMSLTPEAVVRAALRALGKGRSQVVVGGTNQLLVIAGALVPKPLATRVAGMVLARYRRKQGDA
jgi:short-subunit dehydrogenase